MKVRGVVYVHVPVCENSPFGLFNVILYFSSFCTVLYYSIIQQQNVLLRALFDTNVFLPNTKIPTYLSLLSNNINSKAPPSSIRDRNPPEP